MKGPERGEHGLICLGAGWHVEEMEVAWSKTPQTTLTHPCSIFTCCTLFPAFTYLD